MVKIKTRFWPKTATGKPARITATIMEGPYQGRQETYEYNDFDSNAHAEAAQLLALDLLRVSGIAREVEFMDTGSVFEINSDG